MNYEFPSVLEATVVLKTIPEIIIIHAFLWPTWDSYPYGCYLVNHTWDSTTGSKLITKFCLI